MQTISSKCVQSELIKSNKEVKAMKKENQSHIEEILVQKQEVMVQKQEVMVQKQEVKHLHYQLQQISDITMVSQVTNHCSGIFIK